MSGQSGEGSKGSLGKGILVFLILLVCAGGAGFTVGYTQKFAPVESVSPDAAPGAAATAGPGQPSSSAAPATLKKAYWIHTHGYDRAGYAIKVFINDQDVGTFQTPERLVEVTRFVKPGDNRIRFLARALPEGNRTDNPHAHLKLALYQGEKYSSKGFKNGEKLVEYDRKVTETEDFDNSQDFTIIE
jgi:hypothetical protein